MKTRTYIDMVVSLMVSAMLFGAGAVALLSMDALRQEATVLLPLAVLLSFAISPFISYWIAPYLRRNHHSEQ
ncbi:MAG: hypothetical protein JWM58_322 [Rhizobium sp.]|nr:hypothetical protein [Rhizobium sp.]